jgi:hypothetical protein
MGHVLGAGASLEDGQNLGAGINRQPEPEHVLRAAQPGSQFIQVEVWELQMAEGPLVQRLSMLPSASQPRRDGGLTGALRPARPRKGPGLRPARDPHHGHPAREGVCRRDKGVLRLEVNVVWQAGPRKVWIRSA